MILALDSQTPVPRPPEERLAIQQCFDQVQIAVACQNRVQVGIALAKLKRLTDAAKGAPTHEHPVEN